MDNELIYVDTNVFMDFILGRDSSAFNLFMRSLSCEYSIITSDIVLNEIVFQGLDDQYTNLVQLFKGNGKLKVAYACNDDKIGARRIALEHKTDFNDALHKIIAARSGARCIVTKNIRHFICFKDIRVVEPDAL